MCYILVLHYFLNQPHPAADYTEEFKIVILSAFSIEVQELILLRIQRAKIQYSSRASSNLVSKFAKSLRPAHIPKLALHPKAQANGFQSYLR